MFTCHKYSKPNPALYIISFASKTKSSFCSNVSLSKDIPTNWFKSITWSFSVMVLFGNSKVSVNEIFEFGNPLLRKYKSVFNSPA